MNKIVVYTGAFGKDYGFIPQKKIKGVDFVCFTDDVSKVKSPWKTLEVKDENFTNHLSNRHAKLLPHLYFQNYDISIYIDSNYLIVGDILELLEQLGEDFKMGIFDHNQCDDKRNCVYKEHQAILKLGEERGTYKDDPEVMKKQMDFFKNEGYPEENGLIFAAVLIRKHNDPQVIKVMEDWWEMVSTKSKRDQLSFNYVAWKNNFTPTIINGDLRKGNPYFYFLASARKNYMPKFIKYKIKRFFGIKKHP
ncbi:glycosyltransferase domain-containing protein [uncultured Tenacibaculum sp.]|uniref:glycosyltransferase domain-containing protein n=1 Tax=uncultured Tenacibaculum sp. TaxID=174713 RepID=UPI00262BED47|nr:glycosyltransferase domain-containing protein [uncultured Tenacibaculum sp.]